MSPKQKRRKNQKVESQRMCEEEEKLFRKKKGRLVGVLPPHQRKAIKRVKVIRDRAVAQERIVHPRGLSRAQEIVGGDGSLVVAAGTHLRRRGSKRSVPKVEAGELSAGEGEIVGSGVAHVGAGEGEVKVADGGHVGGGGGSDGAAGVEGAALGRVERGTRGGGVASAILEDIGADDGRSRRHTGGNRDGGIGGGALAGVAAVVTTDQRPLVAAGGVVAGLCAALEVLEAALELLAVVALGNAVLDAAALGEVGDLGPVLGGVGAALELGGL